MASASDDGDDDDTLGHPRMWFPDPENVDFSQFESFVVATFEQVSPAVDHLQVRLHERIESPDGDYDFDATVRFELGGLAFLVLVEAKFHRNPIKREVAQILSSKVQSVGAHKGVIVSTAPFQSGTLRYAAAHGIALVKVTEGRFTIETRSADPDVGATRFDARQWGIPDLVGYAYTALDGGGVQRTMVTEQPVYAAELLLGVSPP